jgi:hypothetical protein
VRGRPPERVVERLGQRQRVLEARECLVGVPAHPRRATVRDVRPVREVRMPVALGERARVARMRRRAGAVAARELGGAADQQRGDARARIGEARRVVVEPVGQLERRARAAGRDPGLAVEHLDQPALGGGRRADRRHEHRQRRRRPVGMAGKVALDRDRAREEVAGRGRAVEGGRLGERRRCAKRD